MSPDTRPEVDLTTLSRDRGAPALPRPRRWLRLVLALGFVGACALLFADSLRDLLLGARAVRIVRPVPVSDRAGGPPHAVATQAAGWIEPDPFPAHAAALASGVVAEVLVQESDRVVAGQPVALLIDEDARLALALVEGRLEAARGELAAAVAEEQAAVRWFDEAIELTATLGTAEAELAARRAEVGLREQALVEGRARLRLAEEELLVQRELEQAGVAGPRQVEIAAAATEEAAGVLAGLEAEVARALALRTAAEVELERARQHDELRIEERRRVDVAAARAAAAKGRVAELEALRGEAALRLERMTVRAPVDGVVLERLAERGSPLSGMEHLIATLYDPSSLRARVDVPQQDLGELFVGQAAQVESDARPGRPYAGTVQRIVRRADIQKVTLQAHVRISEPDDLLRPEMLVQVRFLAKGHSGQARPATVRTLAIPARLVVDGRVWVLDPVAGTARARSIEQGPRDGERVLVTDGLDLSDKLLEPLDGRPLTEGERIRLEVGP